MPSSDNLRKLKLTHLDTILIEEGSSSGDLGYDELHVVCAIEDAQPPALSLLMPVAEVRTHRCANRSPRSSSSLNRRGRG